MTRSKDKPIGEVDDYWIRIQFQSRGSPHVHSFWWIKDAPSAATVEGKRSLPAFIDKYISTQLPENDEYLRQLVEQLQCHKHTSTCYKKTRQKCRFDFPYIPCRETRLKTDADEGSPSRFYFTKRGPNDQWINAYNLQILKLWKGNMDIQVVGNHLGAAMYVCMYVSKAEPERLKEALHKVTEKIPHKTSLRKRSSMIRRTVLTYRQISFQETVYRLGGFPFIRSSRGTVTVNCRFPENRLRLLKPKAHLRNLEKGSTDIYVPGLHQYYQDHQTCFGKNVVSNICYQLPCGQHQK